MPIYGYTRVSTTEQLDGSSLEDQRRKITGAALIHSAEAPRFVADEGVSGATPLVERSCGGQLWRDLQCGDTLIASKLDRLFRSAEDALTSARLLQERGVSLILVDIGSDPVTGNGVSKLFFTILAAIAEFERSRIAERMNDGRKGKKAKGGHIGGLAPYGFVKIGNGREARLEPVAHERAAIELAKKLRATGLPLRSVAARLAAEGFLDRTGKPFRAGTLDRVLKGA
jgi:DNA invertase Pin-like site-specific DNA recombinase